MSRAGNGAQGGEVVQSMNRVTVLCLTSLLLLAMPIQAEETASENTATAADKAPKARPQHKPDRARAAGASLGERAESLQNRLLKDIDLSADQAARVDEIRNQHVQRIQEHQDKIRELREEMRKARQAGDSEAVKKQADALREARQASPDRIKWVSDIRQILTPEQRQQFDKNRESMQKEAQKRGQQRRGAQGGEHGGDPGEHR
jgi:Spy/CpxP family protein refolding chaperone